MTLTAPHGHLIQIFHENMEISLVRINYCIASLTFEVHQNISMT